MIINEDYFDNLGIEDEDIIQDNEEPMEEPIKFKSGLDFITYCMSEYDISLNIAVTNNDYDFVKP